MFRNEKTQLLNYYLKLKGFYFIIIIKQFKNFSHKISQIGKTTFLLEKSNLLKKRTKLVNLIW